MSESHEKIIVGSAEWCALPDLGIPAIKARVDSGAKTSSIHAFNIKTFKRFGATWVSFDIHPLQHDRKTTIHCESRVIDRRIIKSSNGTSEKRYVIQANLTIAEQSWDIELTLTNRDSMGHRMLLGREAMHGHMLVDPSLNHNLYEPTAAEINRCYDISLKARAGLKIGLLASNPRLYSNRRIMEAGDELGHEMMFLNIRHCYIKLDANAPEIHYRGGRIINDLDAVITRIRPSMTFYGCALARQFENMGAYTLNHAEAITRSRDKIYALQLLLKNGLHIPVTGFANSPMDTGDLIEMVEGAPLIVKLLEDTQGRGVVLAETQKAAESVINAIKSLNANLLVQEFVKEARGKNLRCFVIDGKVAASVQREAATGEFRANSRQGGNDSIVKISQEERKLAIKAARILGLKVAGIDIIRSSKGPLLLEVNSSPGLEGIESATGKDIAASIIRSAEKHVSWNKQRA
jgi:ribosomal protein S6--L-glutamate ligase